MKPHSAAGGGSRLAIVLSGSPLFSGGAGSGESEIRRWIIENDLLEGIVGLPDQMFYNTGISTYVWIVTNRKPAERAGTVTLVDARGLGTKMRKSLGDKRKELTRDAIDEIAHLFRDALELNGTDTRVKVIRNQDFGFARLTVERPIRRVWRVDETTTATLPPELVGTVTPLMGKTWANEKQAKAAVSSCGLETKQINTVLKSIAVYDAEADPLKAKKGADYEADADLRDQENIPLPDGYLGMSPTEQIIAVRAAVEKHLVDEIHPYVPDAWIDHNKTRIGYEIPFTRQFYVYTTSPGRRDPRRDRSPRGPDPKMDERAIGMRWPEVPLAYLAAIPVTNGLGEAAADGNPTWPRYIRTTDIKSLFTLDEGKRVTLPPDVATPALLARDDLILTAAGSLGTSHLFDGSERACYAGYLVRFRSNPNRVVPRFAAYWSQSQHCLDQIATGAVRSTIDNYSAGKFRATRMPTPPLDEQQRVADFLDDQVARVDNIMGARARQQQLIDDTFTSTLAELFIVGATVPLRRMVREAVVGIVVQPGKYYVDKAVDGVPALRGTNIGEGEVSTRDLVQISKAGHALHPRSVLGAGDVVVVRTGDAGSACVVPTWCFGWNCIDLVIVRPGAGALPAYVEHVLNAARRNSAIAAAASGSIQQHFGVGALLGLPARWRDLDDQQLAVDAADDAQKDARAGSNLLAKSIETLLEVKRALITAAVTGEFDVSTANGSQVPV